MGAAAIPLILSAVGTGVSAYNQNQSLRSQDEAAAQGIRLQADNQRQANAQVNDTIDQLSKSSPEASRASATNAFLEQLRRNQSQAVSGGTPGASSRFAGDMATAKTDVADFGAKAADVLARINAPELQRQAEGQSFGRLASGLDTVRSNSGGDQFLTDLRMRSARPNPWVDAGASVIGGVGQGLASKPSTPKGTVKGGNFNVPRS